MTATTYFRRVFDESPLRGYVTVVFAGDMTSAEVVTTPAKSEKMAAEEAVSVAVRMAAKQRLRLAAFIWRRDQWDGSWGVLA